LILLANGKIVYDGKAGQDAVAYFSKFGLSCPSFFNPADYFMDVVSLDPRDEKTSEDRIQSLIDGWKKTETKQLESVPTKDVAQSIKETTPSRSSYCTQLQVLGKRGIHQVFRNKLSLFVRLFFTLLFSLILAAVYSNTGYDQKSIQSRTGILFFVVVNQSFQGMISTVHVFTVEKSIIMRERQAKSYFISAYYSTKVLTALPADILFPTLFASIIYWAVNLHPTVSAFFIFVAVTVLTSLAAISMGFLIAAMAPSVEASNVMASPLMILQVMFAGFYINLENIPIWLRWLSNFSYVRWAFVSFAINEFEGETFTCTQQGACIATGEQELQTLSFSGYTLGESIRNVILLIAGFHILALLFLRFNRVKYMQATNVNSAKQISNDNADKLINK